MKNLFLFFPIIGTFLIIIGFNLLINQTPAQGTGAPPYGIAEDEIPENIEEKVDEDWNRPKGTPRVGLQVGHWKNSEFPAELAVLRGNHGAYGGGKIEWEVNYDIAVRAEKILEAEGVEVDILPATVPPKYWADVFVTIHADSSLKSSPNGYKFAAPWRDMTGRADELVEHLDKSYSEITGLRYDDNITQNMRGYYAFAWWKFEHAIHPQTTAAIAETGFMSNPSDLRMLLEEPDKPAQGIAQGILSYLRSQELL